MILPQELIVCLCLWCCLLSDEQGNVYRLRVGRDSSTGLFSLEPTLLNQSCRAAVSYRRSTVTGKNARAARARRNFRSMQNNRSAIDLPVGQWAVVLGSWVGG